MDIKAIEYALEDLEQLLKWVNKDCSIAGFLDLVASANTIRIALEKQIAKTPMQNYYNEGDYVWECVSCEEVVAEGQNYCHNCGQKLLELD